MSRTNNVLPQVPRMRIVIKQWRTAVEAGDDTLIDRALEQIFEYHAAFSVRERGGYLSGLLRTMLIRTPLLEFLVTQIERTSVHFEHAFDLISAASAETVPTFTRIPNFGQLAARLLNACLDLADHVTHGLSARILFIDWWKDVVHLTIQMPLVPRLVRLPATHEIDRMVYTCLFNLLRTFSGRYCGLQDFVFAGGLDWIFRYVSNIAGNEGERLLTALEEHDVWCTDMRTKNCVAEPCRHELSIYISVVKSDLIDAFVRHYPTSGRQLRQMQSVGRAKFREAALRISVALRSLNLPALQLLSIIDAAYPNGYKMHTKWNLLVRVKHFVLASKV